MTSDPGIEATVAAYIAYYETLCADTVGDLDALCAPNVRFRDPFNDVVGVDKYRAILERMLDDVRDPEFTVTDRAVSGRVAYLRWKFSFHPRRSRTPWIFEGMSEVHFDTSGKVAQHLDHWDSGYQFFGRIPVLGGLIRLIGRRLSITD